MARYRFGQCQRRKNWDNGLGLSSLRAGFPSTCLGLRGSSGYIPLPVQQAMSDFFTNTEIECRLVRSLMRDPPSALGSRHLTRGQSFQPLAAVILNLVGKHILRISKFLSTSRPGA